MSNILTVRFTSPRTDSFAAFIALADGEEVRISRDPRNARVWKCSRCGRRPGPDCPHLAAVDTLNNLRKEHP